MVSVFDSIAEVNEQLAACKQAIKDVMLGKRTDFQGRAWQAEDLDKLQQYLAFLGKERDKFTSPTSSRMAAVTVIGRPAR